MLKYSVRRLLQSFVTVFIVVSLVFLFLRVMPIERYFDPSAWEKTSWEVKVNTLSKLGLYTKDGQPINPFVQLFNFYQKVITKFDFGVSTVMQKDKPVWDVVFPKMVISMRIGVLGTIFALLIGYAFGLFMGRFKGKLFDSIGQGYIVFVQAIPTIVLYFILQTFFVELTGFPTLFKATDPKTYVIPIVIMSITGGMTGTATWVRRFTVDQLNSDYVKLAYAKGLPGVKVMVFHVLRNAFVPMAYNLPVAFAMTISGTLVIERLFAINGMGSYLVDCVSRGDNNLVQCIVLVYSTISVLSLFLGDILVTIVDPRIKLTSRGGAR